MEDVGEGRAGGGGHALAAAPAAHPRQHGPVGVAQAQAGRLEVATQVGGTRQGGHAPKGGGGGGPAGRPAPTRGPICVAARREVCIKGRRLQDGRAGRRPRSRRGRPHLDRPVQPRTQNVALPGHGGHGDRGVRGRQGMRARARRQVPHFEHARPVPGHQPRPRGGDGLDGGGMPARARVQDGGRSESCRPFIPLPRPDGRVLAARKQGARRGGQAEDGARVAGQTDGRTGDQVVGGDGPRPGRAARVRGRGVQAHKQPPPSSSRESTSPPTSTVGPGDPVSTSHCRTLPSWEPVYSFPAPGSMTAAVTWRVWPRRARTKAMSAGSPLYRYPPADVREPARPGRHPGSRPGAYLFGRERGGLWCRRPCLSLSPSARERSGVQRSPLHGSPLFTHCAPPSFCRRPGRGSRHPRRARPPAGTAAAAAGKTTMRATVVPIGAAVPTFFFLLCHRLRRCSTHTHAPRPHLQTRSATPLCVCVGYAAALVRASGLVTAATVVVGGGARWFEGRERRVEREVERRGAGDREWTAGSTCTARSTWGGRMGRQV